MNQEIRHDPRWDAMYDDWLTKSMQDPEFAAAWHRNLKEIAASIDTRIMEKIYRDLHAESEGRG
jgi:hypothetical protein